MGNVSLKLTAEQRRAVAATGRSLIVSAAAGSGKTAVLAHRCAYLVCDAPEPYRCDVDHLLVLTYTEAAAAEMRTRIIEAVRARAAADPSDERIQRQLALADVAQISTLHAYCLWLIRRWFTELAADPSAAVMDAEEATLLRKEVLDQLCKKLYARAAVPDDPLGRRGLDACPTAADDLDVSDWQPGRRSIDALAPEFLKLVDLYGLGDDQPLRSFVLRLYEFTRSLPDPLSWLNESVTRLTLHSGFVLTEVRAALRLELTRQEEFCDRAASRHEDGPAYGHYHAARIRDYAEQVERWRAEISDSVDRFDAVQQSIDGFDFGRHSAPRFGKEVDPHVREAREKISEFYSTRIKKSLLRERLRNRFARFSSAEIRAYLQQTAPFVASLADLVLHFDDAYSLAKRRLNVLDFADLERFALTLLRRADGLGEPSDIARTLHDRFTHVLVDEFQDVNPVQQEILRLTSRESDSSRPGNLFVVGDVKQSIYRFRLAEPTLFTDRVDLFRQGGVGEAVFLQHNFRSRPELLDGVNLVFRQLMRPGLGPAVYDELAELRPGRPIDPARKRRPIELHLLERRAKPSGDDDGQDESPNDDETTPSDLSSPQRWTDIEREAYLIASTIRDAVRAPSDDDGPPLRYGDIAVLLRSTKHNAERVAYVLSAMGVPAFADVGGSLFSALEIRDVLAALEVMDNLQQDIPLAGVLRSGVFGERFTADELAEVRCVEREVPFHQAVRTRAERDDPLGTRLRLTLTTIARYRDDARRRPLAEVLSRLYDEQAYLAYASGLPNGPQRRANLLKLHELARRFGAFRRQGLHRFLRFIRSLQEEEQELAVAPSLGESEDVVRIMSIHQAKGLEFPVVFVAGLGKKFNLGDRAGRMLFERKARIGLRVVDGPKCIEFPTAAHHLVVDEIERTTREEETRILYVALTRAKERLVLIGSLDDPEQALRESRERTGETPTALELGAARRPLDWLLAAIAAEPSNPVFTAQTHTAGDMSAWRIEKTRDSHDAAVQTAVARGEKLPPGEPFTPDDPVVEQVLNRQTWVYPHAGATAIRATVAAGELKGLRDSIVNPDERRPAPPTEIAFVIPSSKYADRAFDPAIHRGIVTHRVLQHLDFQRALDGESLASELQRMIDGGILGPADRALVDEAALAWFVSTPLTARIRRSGSSFRREFRFLATEPASTLDPGLTDAADDRVLVRGIVDGILVGVDAVEVLDYKTDSISAEQATKRAERYRGPMTLYASAVERLWHKPVRSYSLVFLTPRQIVECPIRAGSASDR